MWNFEFLKIEEFLERRGVAVKNMTDGKSTVDVTGLQ